MEKFRPSSQTCIKYSPNGTSKNNRVNLDSQSSVIFYEKDTPLNFVAKSSKYTQEDLNKLITNVTQFTDSVAKATTGTLTDKILENAITLRINRCMLIVLEAIHAKINFPLRSHQHPDFCQDIYSNYLSLIKNEWGEIEHEAAMFYNSLKYLIDSKTSPELKNEVSELKGQLEMFAEHQNTASIYFFYREAIGKPMTQTFQTIQNMLKKNVLIAADNIEKSKDIDQLINQSKDLTLLRTIKQALQIKNQLPLLFSPSTRNIRLNKIENKIKNLNQDKCTLS